MVFISQQSELAEGDSGKRLQFKCTPCSLHVCLHLSLSLSLSLSHTHTHTYTLAHLGCLLSQGELTQLHTTLTEAFTCVIHVLHKLKEQSSGADYTHSLESLTTAVVRVLGAWLAEESLSLSNDVYLLLPFLIELCLSRLTEGEDKDLLKFLLPGLSHLSAEDKPRRILLEANLPKLLLTYIEKLLPLHQSSRYAVYPVI